MRKLEEPESPSTMNQVEFLQKQAILLNERRIKLENEIYYFKSNVELLGKVADLIGRTTLLMMGCWKADGEDLRLPRLRICVKKVAAASQMMFDMT